MSTINNIKKRLIRKIVASNDESLLETLEKVMFTSEPEKTSFSTEQMEMLLMSEKDIEEGNLISEEELARLDSEWMN